MDFGAIISDSIDYSRDALVGRWMTWLVFIICSLPMALIQFTFDPEKLSAAKPTDWQDILSLIPWPQILALCIAGFLLSFIISGYIVRVYRGTTPPPEFDNWGSLYLDGIKLMIVDTLWCIPGLLVLVIAFALFFSGAVVSRESNGLMIGLMLVGLLLSLAACVLLVIGCLYSILGNVRFARTGSIREGIRFSAINSTMQAIGFGTYIIALIVLLVVGCIFSVIVGVLAMIPFAGWVIALILNPLLSVFCARFTSRIYDLGVPQTPEMAPAP